MNPIPPNFYAAGITAKEARDLATASNGLHDEIEVMKVAIRRFFMITEKRIDQTNEAGFITCLEELGKATTKLARLIDIQAKIDKAAGQGRSSLDQAIITALTEVRKEMGIDD